MDVASLRFYILLHQTNRASDCVLASNAVQVSMDVQCDLPAAEAHLKYPYTWLPLCFS